MKYGKRIICILTVGILFIGIGMRIYKVNAAVEKIPEQIYEFGETAELGNNIIFGDTMDGYSIKINEVDLLSTEEFIEKYQCEKKDLPNWEYMPKVFDIEIEVSNEDNERTGIDLNQLYLENKAGLVSFDAIYYRIANADTGYVNTGIAVRPGTSVTLRVEFPVSRLNFSRRAMKNLWEQELKLVVTLYPEKKVMALR